MTALQSEQLVEAYQGQMLAVAERILHNRHDAEDAVQTAFLRIFRVKLPENEASLRAYCLTAAKHAALDLLPKQSKGVELETVISPAPDDLFETVANSMDYERLLAAINSLPGKYAEILMLHYVQQLEVKELAKLLNRRRVSVYKQLGRAKALLLQIYQKEDFYNE